MMYLWFKALHVIFMVMWFAGLFYLPRLFVYHAMSQDSAGIERFKTMERKLYYGITYPGGILTTLFGGMLLLRYAPLYQHAIWMHVKLSLVLLLWIYHLSCGHFLKRFKKNQNLRTHVFFRWFNEIPVLFLACICILVIVKPF